MKHPHLFEISAWPWLERLSRQESRFLTLEDVPPREWDAIAARGFAYVFLMGVWQRSTLGREIALADVDLRAEYDRALPAWTPADVCGSPYCVRAYEPDRRMGGWPGLDAAREALNARGIGLVLDFVPNHTAFDHSWTERHPERYVLGTREDERRSPRGFRRAGQTIIACARDPFFPPWTDVAQLNLFNPDTRSALGGELRAIASHCDGVRCDMAMLILNRVFDRTWRPTLGDSWPAPEEEFWPGAIARVPQLLMIAEVYWDLEWTLQQLGFHYTYDKRLLDRLHSAPARDICGHLRAERAFADRLARFLENHDEPRSGLSLRHRLPAAAVIAGTLPGMRFYFDGQLDGRKLRTPVQLGRWADEPSDPALQDLYSRLLETTSARLFHDGDWRLLDATDAGGSGTEKDLVAYRWRLEDAFALVVANFGPRESTGHIPLAGELPQSDAYDFVDVLSKTTYPRSAAALVDGLYVRLDPGGAHLFVVRGVPTQSRAAA